MMRNSKRRMVAGLVVTLGVADGVGIYVAQHRLDKSDDVSPREMAVANEALNEPIAIRANGELKTGPVLAASVVAPPAAPAQAAPQTVRFALAEPVKVPAAPVAPAAVRTSSRQTAPVVTGRMAAAEKPVSRHAVSRHSAALASAASIEDLRVHEQRIPARLPHAEHRPASEDAFAAAFGSSEDQLRLPDPAYARPDPQSSGQASAELPPLELSASQIHSEPSGTSDADAPPAPPPTTATSSDDIQPKS